MIKKSIGIALFLGMLGFAVSWFVSSCRPCNCEFEPRTPRKFFVEALGFDNAFEIFYPNSPRATILKIRENDITDDTASFLLKFAYQKRYVTGKSATPSHPCYGGFFINTAYACDCTGPPFVEDIALDSVKVQVFSVFALGKNIEANEEITQHVEVHEDILPIYYSYITRPPQPTKDSWLPAGLIYVRFLDSSFVRNSISDSITPMQLKVVATLKSGRRDTALSSKLLIRPL